MDGIKNFIQALIASPHYSYGWILLACLAILPAIVSANLVQQEITKLFSRRPDKQPDIFALLVNVLILLISIAIITYAFYLYAWK